MRSVVFAFTTDATEDPGYQIEKSKYALRNATHLLSIEYREKRRERIALEPRTRVV